MNIGVKTGGIHHLALRVSDLARAKKFYLDTLGFHKVLEADNLMIFMAGGAAIVVRGPDAKTNPGDRFDPFRVGLDHVALSCDSEDELERVAQALKAAGIVNTGIKRDEVLGKLYVAFKDPDRISWEYFMQ